MTAVKVMNIVVRFTTVVTKVCQKNLRFRRMLELWSGYNMRQLKSFWKTMLSSTEY